MEVLNLTLLDTQIYLIAKLLGMTVGTRSCFPTGWLKYSKCHEKNPQSTALATLSEQNQYNSVGIYRLL
jgi:hypothetical protein